MPISPLPWKAVQAANIKTKCWIIEDATGKPVVVAADVALDMHYGWTKMTRDNVEAIVCAVNNMGPLLKAAHDALTTPAELHPSYHEPLRSAVLAVLDTWHSYMRSKE